MNQQPIKLAEEFKGKNAFDVLQMPWVKDRFVATHAEFHKRSNPEAFWSSEVEHFRRALLESADLQACTPFTVYGVIMDLAATGLTINPSTRLAYLFFRNANVTPKGSTTKVFEKRMFYMITPQGELSLRQRMGQIKYADNPVVVYDGDSFKMGMDERGKYVKYEMAIPRKSNKIIGCFMRIVRPDSSLDFGVMLQEDIDRLKGYSSRSNSKYEGGQRIAGAANELYTSDGGQIDKGFLETKCIKHSFKSYPKIQLGNFAALESETEENHDGEEQAAADHSTISYEEEYESEVQVAEEVVDAVGERSSDVEDPTCPF